MKKILDVGCSDRPTGTINIDVSLGFHIRKADLDLLADGNYLPFRDNTFGLVKANHVLEHVENPYHLIRELCRVSKKYVYICVPNPQNWRVLLRDQLDVLSKHYYQGHSIRELKQMFEFAGLKIVKQGFGRQNLRKLNRILKRLPRIDRIEIEILGRKFPEWDENLITSTRILRVEMTDEEWEDLLDNDDDVELRQAVIDGRFDLLGIDRGK